MLAHDPASLSENFQEGNCLRVWGYQLTGSYAAVPANGPAANESQPHPLPDLRCSAANRGPKIKIRHPSTVTGHRSLVTVSFWAGRVGGSGVSRLSGEIKISVLR